MSWSVLWILDFPLKEASGDSEDRVQEENPDDTYWLDENDNGSCCGSSTGCYSGDDVAEVWFFSNEVLEHKGVYNEISPKETEPVDEELRQQTLRDDSKKFWEACLAHGY